MGDWIFVFVLPLKASTFADFSPFFFFFFFLYQDHDVMTLLGDDASDQSVMNATGQSDSSADHKGIGMGVGGC